MKSKRAQEAVAGADDKPANGYTDENPTNKKRKRSDDDAKADSGKKPKKDKTKYSKEGRKELKEKRKNLQDLPEADDEPDANGELSKDDAVEKQGKTKKKAEKSKKERKAEMKAKKKELKELKDKKKSEQRKAAKRAKEAALEEAVSHEDAIPEGASNGIDLDMDETGLEGAGANTAQNGESGAATTAAAAAAAEGETKADRHIVFVGNLPFTATAASISAHFASLSPIAVRCLTNKGDTKNTCKGIAFVEFSNVSAQRTCLDRFHHSEFDDGQSAPRKINVELSAGGGGNKSAHRVEKIREKNRKLDENRAKRIEKEKTAAANEAAGAASKVVDAGSTEEQQQHMDEQVHPSRRAQMGGDAPPEDDFNDNGHGRRGGGRGGRGGGGSGGRGRGRGGRRRW